MGLQKSSSIQRAMWAAAARDLGVESPEIPESIDHIQAQMNYPPDIFVLGEALPIFISPWDGEIYFVAIIILRTITGGPSLIDFKIDGGSSIAQLSTDGLSVGEAASVLIDPVKPILSGAILCADSDGAASGQSSVAVFAGVRSAPV